MNNKILFSNQLEAWLQSKKPKKIAGLLDVFDEKSFAVCLLVLMIFPATPLPTGGLTHVFEIIAIFLALQMLFGKKTVWLPKKWRAVDISGISKGKAASAFIGRLKWVEKRSKPRLIALLQNGTFLKVSGLIIIIFSLTAFLAPPFSGLDTLPSLGVVLMALAIIFEDIVLYILGLISGIIGIGIIFAIGDAILTTLKLWF